MPITTSSFPTRASCWRGRPGSAWPATVANATVAKVPSTVPARKPRPERLRLSDSRMKMVAVMGTLLSAAARASGIS